MLLLLDALLLLFCLKILSKNRSVERLNGFNLVVGAPGIVGSAAGSYKLAVVLANGMLETVFCGIVCGIESSDADAGIDDK